MANSTGGEAVGPAPNGTNVGRIWREPSYDFWSSSDTATEKDKDKREENAPDNGSGSYRFDFQSGAAASASSLGDPPSLLIGQFLHKQKESGEFAIDIDLEMSELQDDGAVLAPVPESSPFPPTARTATTARVSFDPNPPGSAGSVRRRNNYGNDTNGSKDGEEITLSRDHSFKSKSSLLKERTKSRLLDASPRHRLPPPAPEKSSRLGGRSGQLKSGFLGKGNLVEDDLLFDEDLPDEHKCDKLDKGSLMEWLSLVLIIAALACTLAIPYLRYKNLLKLQLWKWEVFVLVLICGRLVSGWVIRIIVFFLERNFLLGKRVLYFVYGVKKAVQNSLWLGLVLVSCHYLLDKSVE